MPTTVQLPSSTDEIDVEAVDRLLYNEMDKLSIEERYRAKMDIEGKNVLAAVEPTQLTRIGLDALDHELLCLVDKPYYNMARSMNSPMIAQNEWKLRFLRADCFDHVKAARRIERHLKFMHDCFGKEALLRPVRMSDLDKVCVR
jgi:hypothetical protein